MSAHLKWSPKMPFCAHKLYDMYAVPFYLYKRLRSSPSTESFSEGDGGGGGGGESDTS